MSRTLFAVTSAASVAISAAVIVIPVDAGGTDCDSAVGPDVIVGVIPNVSNYSSVGGIEAFAIGTTSCNIGDEELIWIANSNQHPVIGQNLFRHDNGRFEQIGQAWLKHGFTALQQDACGCGCIPSGTGSRLGVGCSDPYSSGLNGSQGGMGPKYEVDAHSGFFNWPADDFNNTGNSVYKRLQAAISDIDPGQNGGGQYLVEAQYVAADDSDAFNQDNNASWRPCSISGSGSTWNMSLTGSTVREQPAIMAWQFYDSTVSIAEARVPGEGLMYVGWKVTPVGGEFLYEFAVQNLNSHRSASGFVIPLPNGATVSNTGFHDVDYHSGEPWSGTDWQLNVASDEVRWDTQSFAQNPNANALRWGTLYNFRFQSDASPSQINQAEIVLFRPGGPDSFTVDLVPNGQLLGFSYPNGLPDLVGDQGDTMARVEVFALAGDPQPGTGTMTYRIDGGSFTTVAMNIVSDNVYDATFPAAPCGSLIEYYFNADPVVGGTQTDPADAPDSLYTAIAADTLDVAFEDDFEANLGWTVTNSGGLTDGAWERGTPVGGGDRGDPPADGDGSGQCYLTDNVDGNSDVDGGTTTLTSPVLDASNATLVEYYRWFDNTFGAAPGADVMTVEVSDDAGATWTVLEIVGPNTPESSGGWWLAQHSLTNIAGFTPNDQFRLRVSAEDLGEGSVVEAGFDGFLLTEVSCDTTNPCPADFNGDGTVDVGDLLAMLGAWGTPGADITGDGTTDVSDLLALLGDWGPCP